MQHFMIMLLVSSFSMSVLGALYTLSMPWLSRLFSEKGRYYSWLIILLGFLIPFRPKWSRSLIHIGVADCASIPIVQIRTGADSPFTIPISALPLEGMFISGARFTVSWWQIGFVVWLLGVVLFLGYHLVKHYRFTKMIRRFGEPIANEEFLNLFEQLKSEMKIKKKIPLVLCTVISSPMLIGVFKPQIYLPTTTLKKEKLLFILKHELVHYKRRDLLYKYLTLLTTALHWFNPVVYLIASGVELSCEMSCDAEVVRQQGEEIRRSYGKTIIDVVAYHRKPKTMFSTDFGGGKKELKNRIFTIMDARKKRAGILLCSIILILTVGSGYLLSPPLLVAATERAREQDEAVYGWSEVLTMFQTKHAIDYLPAPTYFPEDFVIKQAWFYPEMLGEEPEQVVTSALYLRIGNEEQSFDMEIKILSKAEEVFDSWMLHSPEIAINGRRVVRDSGWLSIQIEDNLRYTFMWGASSPTLVDPLGDDTFIEIAESIR